MKNIVLLIVVMALFTGCEAQSNKEEKDSKAEAKGLVKPQTDYKVNKEYDENGNLIGYDSTYTYYYSNIDKDALKKDSIFKEFNKHFMDINPFENNPFLINPLQQDSMLEEDFFKEDFFRNSFEKNQAAMIKMLDRMDSLKNEFFLQEYPIKK